MIQVKTTSKTLIVNEKNELLLLKIGIHTEQPERSYTIDLPGGFVEDDEPERIGAVREIKEETDIDIEPEKLVLVYGETSYYENKSLLMTHLRYLIKLDFTPEVTVSWEHESYEWADFDTVLQKYELRPHFQKAIKNVQLSGLLTS